MMREFLWSLVRVMAAMVLATFVLGSVVGFAIAASRLVPFEALVEVAGFASGLSGS